MEPFFFHATHPTSVPLSQPWTTSINTWWRLVRTSSTPRPFVLPLLSQSKHWTAITIKRTTQMFIGLQWVRSSHSFLFHSFSSHLLQFSTLVINYIISRPLDGRMPGSTHLERLSAPNLISHMRLWMSTSNPNTLRLPLLRCASYISSLY
jgi:hypothetical protein